MTGWHGGGTPGIALLIAPKIINTEFIYKTSTCEDLKRRNNDCTKANGVSVGPGKSPGPLGLVAGYPPVVSAADLFRATETKSDAPSTLPSGELGGGGEDA